MALKTVASSGGVSGAYLCKKFGFQQTTTDTDSLFSDDSIDTIVIATRHDSHARFVCRALKSGKNVFVEKPLALNNNELADIESIYASLQKSKNAPIL